MTIVEAYAILRVNSTCSDAELKSAYRVMAKKYHPDYYMGKPVELSNAEQMMKKINEAYELISEHRKKYESRSETFNLDDYKNELKAKLSCYYYAKGNFIANNFQAFNDEIKRLINEFEGLCTFCTSKQAVDDYFKMIKMDIRKVFEKLKRDIFSYYAIDENEVREKLNYECNLRDFFTQLTDIRKKYSKKDFYERKLADELADYQLRAGYLEIKLSIDALVNSYLDKLRANGFRDYDMVIKILKTKIDELFTRYFKYRERLQNIESFFNDRDLNNEYISNLKALYQYICKSLNNGVNLNKIDEDLTQLEVYIREIIGKEKEQERQQKLFAVAGDLNQKYIGIISQFKNLNNVEYLQRITRSYAKVLKYIQLLRDGKMPDETSSVLESITFNNDEEDLKRFNFLDNYINVSSGLYILNIKPEFAFTPLIGEVVEACDNYVVFKSLNWMGKCDVDRIDADVFMQSFISLDQFMNESEFGLINPRRKTEVILYHSQVASLVYDVLDNVIKVKSFSDSNDLMPMGVDYDELLGKYQNPKAMYAAIKNMFGEPSQGVHKKKFRV